MAQWGDARCADRDALCRRLDRPDTLPVPTRRGGRLYNVCKDAEHPRGVWRRTTLASCRTPAPHWDVLLDLDALAAAEGEDWIWQGAATLPPAHARVMPQLSRGGSDAVVLRAFDLVARRFVTDGFALPEAKRSVAWLDSDTLLLATALGGATLSG
jgi:prolyl oligopeptidase